MNNYNRFRYIYPPRPESTIPPNGLEYFNSDNYIAQPKLNGSSMELYTDGKHIITMNRHKQVMSHKLDVQELKNLHRGNGWMVLCGEYMNKKQRDEKNEYWNIKFVIWDILVFEGEHLLKSTFLDRENLLKKLYKTKFSKLYLDDISENCFRVKSFYDHKWKLKDIYDSVSKIEMYEGLVLKKKDGKLENGIRPNNNSMTQIKCRKPTKNYAF